MVIRNGLQNFETMLVEKSLEKIEFHRGNALVS